jgi:AraC family transcriptional regulator
MDSLVERYDVATKQRKSFTPGHVSLTDSGQWPGVRLEVWDGPSAELPESVLFQHGLALNIGDPVASEIRWAGHRSRSGVFEQGTMTLLPAGVPYRSRSRGHWRGLTLTLHSDLLDAVAPPRGAGTADLLPAFAATDPYVWHAAHSLASDARDGSPAGALFGQTIAAGLAAHLMRHYSVRRPRLIDAPDPSDRRLGRIREFILDQLERPLSLAELAAIAEMEVYTFAKWFKRAAGASPHQYILRARIQRARNLLTSSSGGLADIALECGFSSHSHFTTTFRRCVGITPKDYRARTSRARTATAR